MGGKSGRPDSIGRFGLGALSMYHFTDVSERSAHQPVAECLELSGGHGRIEPARHVSRSLSPTSDGTQIASDAEVDSEKGAAVSAALVCIQKTRS
jgi:hypothetical protein